MGASGQPMSRPHYAMQVTPVHTVDVDGWTQEPIWTVLEKRQSCFPARIQTPDRPDSS